MLCIRIWTRLFIKGTWRTCKIQRCVQKKLSEIWQRCKNVFCSVWWGLSEKRSLANTCWPQCCLNFHLSQKHPPIIGQITGCAYGRRFFAEWVLEVSYCGKRHFGMSFPSISNHIIISNMLVKISSHEVSQKAVFWPFSLIICLHEVFMLYMVYLEKMFHTLVSIQTNTTII